MRVEFTVVKFEFELFQQRPDRVTQCQQPVGRTVQPEPDHARPFHRREHAKICRPEIERLVLGYYRTEGHLQQASPFRVRLSKEMQGDMGIPG